MCVEALAVIAFSDLYLVFWVRRFGPLSRLWCFCSMAIGLALIVVAAPHF